jgi:hypothetical protein
VATSAGNPLDDSGPLATSSGGGDGDLQSLRADLRSLLAEAAAAAAAEWGERYDEEGNEVYEMDGDSVGYDDDEDDGEAGGGAFLTGVADEEESEADRVRDMQTMMQQVRLRHTRLSIVTLCTRVRSCESPSRSLTGLVRGRDIRQRALLHRAHLQSRTTRAALSVFRRARGGWAPITIGSRCKG